MRIPMIMLVMALTLAGQSAFAQSRDQVAKIESNIKTNSDKIEGLVKVIGQQNQAIMKLQEELAHFRANELVPEGAVMAFENDCPTGWSLQEQTNGRMILGKALGENISNTEGIPAPDSFVRDYLYYTMAHPQPPQAFIIARNAANTVSDTDGNQYQPTVRATIYAEYNFCRKN